MTPAGTFDLAGFTAALDEVRHSLNMTWSDVAAGAGIYPATVSRLVRGEMISVPKIVALAAWAQLSFDDFVQVVSVHPDEPRANRTTPQTDAVLGLFHDGSMHCCAEVSKILDVPFGSAWAILDRLGRQGILTWEWEGPHGEARPRRKLYRLA